MTSTAEDGGKRIAIASGAVVAAGAAAALFMPAHSDAAASNRCPGDTLCLFGNNSFGGCLSWYRSSLYNYRGVDWQTCRGDSMNDDVDSVWNNTSKWVRFYDDGGGSYDYTLCVPPGVAHHNLESVHMSGTWPFVNGWGDDISRHSIYSSQPSGCDTTLPNRQGCSY